jgi:predicted hydrocarbon binding protein
VKSREAPSGAADEVFFVGPCGSAARIAYDSLALRARELRCAPGAYSATGSGKEEKDAGFMEVKIKLNISITVSGSSLEEAMAEYDEITVEGLFREIIDKAIACDEVTCKVEEGPNDLEQYDSMSQGG